MSIFDIAKDANVSVSTVSRFFNRPELLSPEIAAKIEEIVAKRNYRPRIVRPGPKGNERIGIRNGVIALVSLTDFSPADMWRMPILPLLIGSVQSILLRKQLSLFLGQIDRNGRLPECVSPRRCDGVIFFSKPHDPEILARFRKSIPDLPAVWCFREHADDEGRFDHIFYDNAAVGEIAADDLASRGHRKVAIFNLDSSHTAYPERESSEYGMQAFCRIGGTRIRPERIWNPRPEIHSGRKGDRRSILLCRSGYAGNLHRTPGGGIQCKKTGHDRMQRR